MPVSDCVVSACRSRAFAFSCEAFGQAADQSAAAEKSLMVFVRCRAVHEHVPGVSMSAQNSVSLPQDVAA